MPPAVLKSYRKMLLFLFKYRKDFFLKKEKTLLEVN